ncbi:MAG: hypothetical protein JWQ90_4600 [Hydrocarboniphaga sp.]|uniref:hypothetical protein n=1 Tax=Hydrocarboniphaga sp. TaxID=2033016 RepID=UPI002615E238|nr:hypothetical protein [Hydrocarboniphaga sp.]MDB5972150.1 hypothetical protein [Hydrocarboniphaga sp.]
MRLSHLLLRVLLLAAVVLGVAQWWALHQAELAAQRFIYQWQAYGQIRYETLWVNLWGSGVLRGVSMQPSGLSQAMLGTPLEYRITAKELRIDRLDLADDGSLEHARVRLIDLSLPMSDGYRLRGRDVPPALSALGYPSLDLQAKFDVRSLPDAGLLLIDGDLDGADSAGLRFGLQLDATPAQLAHAPDQVGLRKLQLDYQDRGLMSRYLDRRALDLNVSREAAPETLIGLLDQRAKREHWRWDAASAAALRGFIRYPQACRVVMDPPAEVILRNLNLYAVGDWAPLLGFRFQLLQPKPGTAVR